MSLIILMLKKCKRRSNLRLFNRMIPFKKQLKTKKALILEFLKIKSLINKVVRMKLLSRKKWTQMSNTSSKCKKRNKITMIVLKTKIPKSMLLNRKYCKLIISICLDNKITIKLKKMRTIKLIRSHY